MQIIIVIVFILIVLIAIGISKNISNESLDDFIDNETSKYSTEPDYKCNAKHVDAIRRKYKIHDKYTLFTYAVSIEHISEVSRPEQRVLPFLAANAQLISNDTKIFKYKNLFVKPDMIVKDEKHLYFCEIKSKKICEYDDNNVWKHLLQVVISAYCYNKSHGTDVKDIKVYLRYLDCYVEITNWEQFLPYIGFAHNIYLCNVKDEVASAELANFIVLICNDIGESPKSEADHKLKGLGVHGMFAYEGAIPKLLSQVE